MSTIGAVYYIRYKNFIEYFNIFNIFFLLNFDHLKVVHGDDNLHS